MGFMTRSKDGNKDNASYLFFEDKLGNESVDLHSERDMNVSVEGIHKETVHKETIYNHKLTRAITVEDHDTQTFNKGQTICVSAEGRKETIVDNETKSVTGYSDNSYTKNLVIKTDASVSTLAADKIMYEVPEVVFGQVVNAQGQESQLPPVPTDQRIGPIPKEGSVIIPHPDPFNAMSLNTPNALAYATKVTYKRGVVTDIQGMEMRTIHKNQMVKVKGNVGRSIDGRLDEIVQEGIKIYSPKTITIESPEKVEILSSGEYFEYKNAAASLKLNDISVNMTSLSLTPILGATINNLKLENQAIAVKWIGGKFEAHMGGTEIKIRTFAQYLAALTNFS